MPYSKEWLEADALASTIRRHWTDRGFADVRVWTEAAPINDGKGPMYVVRSNVAELMARAGRAE